MTFIPYLTFDGTARAALSFYSDVFGASDLTLMPFADAPASEGLPASDRIMYGHIMLGDACLMASDLPEGAPYAPMQSVSVNHPVPDVATGQALFDRLAAGGTVKMPFGPTFWSPGFGVCVDRFGAQWMIGVASGDEPA